MTTTRPFRRVTLQSLQIFFADALTFIIDKLHRCYSMKFGILLETINDATLCQVIGTNFNFHVISRQNTNTKFSHFP